MDFNVVEGLCEEVASQEAAELKERLADAFINVIWNVDYGTHVGKVLARTSVVNSITIVVAELGMYVASMNELRVSHCVSCYDDSSERMNILGEAVHRELGVQ